MLRTLSTVAVLLAGTAACAQDTTAKIDAIFAPLTNAKSPGLAVLVREDGRMIFERGYGVRDLRTMAPIDAQTDFRLASFTKQFTAMATMLLVHDGKLRYDEPLTEIFPGFPAYSRGITIRHLLTHTGGLKDYEDLMDQRWTAAHQIQDAEVLELLKQQTAGKFAPGTKWEYSNAGYVLLGLAVAQVSGKSYPEFLHDRIFAPLHMDHTLAFVNGKNTVPNRAYGYAKRKDALEENDQSSTSATLGDGGVYSNLTDLAKWDDALRNHTLLSEAEMKPALTPVKLADGSLPPELYGFGWFLKPYNGRATMWHTGSTSGFRTVIMRFTDEKLTIIILANRTDLDPEALARKVADLIPAPRTTARYRP